MAVGMGLLVFSNGDSAPKNLDWVAIGPSYFKA